MLDGGKAGRSVPGMQEGGSKQRLQVGEGDIFVKLEPMVMQ